MPWYWRLDLETMDWEPCWKERSTDNHHPPWAQSFSNMGRPVPDDGLIGPEILTPGPPRLVGTLPQDAYPEGHYDLHLVPDDEEASLD